MHNSEDKNEFVNVLSTIQRTIETLQKKASCVSHPASRRYLQIVLLFISALKLIQNYKIVVVDT